MIILYRLESGVCLAFILYVKYIIKFLYTWSEFFFVWSKTPSAPVEESRSIPLLPFWAYMACSRASFTFTFFTLYFLTYTVVAFY
jgi:hypothetical protein